MTTRILLADDHRMMREGLRALLEEDKALQVAGEAETGREAVRMAREIAPDLVIMDVAMPDLNGIEATRKILAERPDTRILALSMHADPRYVAEILKAGATGYVLKDAAFEEMHRAIDVVLQGKVYLCSDIAGVVVEGYLSGSPGGGDRSAATVLSDREREVLQLIAEGKSTREIAEILHVSVKTVESHRLHIMRKLEIRTVAELTKYAIREGITTLDDA